MLTSAPDQELLARQVALQAEATQVLAELDLGQRFADVGPVLVVGSYLSGLMCWRDLDICLLAGVDCSPADVLELLKRVVELPGLVGFSYRDERGERCPTGEARDERYHVPFDLDAGQGRWRIDLSCGSVTCMLTSPTGIPSCATPSPTSSGWPCCGSRTCGIGSRATPMR
jgi:hypothetical protein